MDNLTRDVGFGPSAKVVIDSVVAKVAEIDAQLTRLNELLNTFQPPFPGKITIDFRKKRGRITPRFVVWKQNKKKNWYLVELSRQHISLRVKSQADFHQYANAIRHLTKLGAELMERRVMTMGYVNDLVRLVARTTPATEEVIERATAEIDHVFSQIEAQKSAAKE